MQTLHLRGGFCLIQGISCENRRLLDHLRYLVLTAQPTKISVECNAVLVFKYFSFSEPNRFGISNYYM